MQALTQVHMMNNHISPRHFFQAAYYWRYSKDIPELSLANDNKLFDEQGRVPCYVTDYLIHIYGAQ